MPEIGEVARVVHYLKKHVIGRTISKLIALDDNKVFKDCTGEDFRRNLTGKRVLDARQQGKYFWLVMSSPPHPLMHLGMTGWIRLSNEATAYYRPENEDPQWPPRFWKFQMEFEETDAVKAAFVDSRRFARVRLLDCDAAEISQIEPLNRNGPDPIHQSDQFTLDYFAGKVRSKKVPIKALLLDQAQVSGLGNWVCDELLYHAKVHPEQYCDTLSDDQVKQLYDSINHVAGTACEVLSDASKFPTEWIMPYRWGKGKGGNILPNGEKLTFITAAGRTSAIVMSRQKKFGRVTESVKLVEPEDEGEGEEIQESSSPARPAQRREANYQKSKKRKRKRKDKDKDSEAEAEQELDTKRKQPTQRRTKRAESASEPTSMGQKSGKTSKKRQSAPDQDITRRRSSRLSGVGVE